jgi:pimeloyl-ACP methyl ester carboxylesterase
MICYKVIMTARHVALALFAQLCCCASTPPPPAARASASAPADERLPAVKVRIAIATPLAGSTDVVGLLWMPSKGATSVIVCVHGSGGAKENWGPIGVPGYSFAHAMVAERRAVLAIDLPGYGESKAASDQQSMEDFALAVDQVARAMRAGAYRAEVAKPQPFAHVIGNGLSIGALIVEIAQGKHASFDAVIAGGWSQGAFSGEYLACLYRAQCPQSPLSEVWYLPNVEPAVIDDIKKTRPNRLTPSGRTSVHAWGGKVFVAGEKGGSGEGAPLPPGTPLLSDLTRTIRVPVLIVFGENDFTFDMAKAREEIRYFPGSTDVRVELFPATGHFIRWHRTNAKVDALVLAWLRARSL